MILFNLKRRRHRDKDKTKMYPMVTVQLPIYNEQFVITRLIKRVCKLNYPREKLEIQILDDSTDQTREIVEELVRRYKERGFDIKAIRRDDRKGYKAGALQNGLKSAKGELLAIFDADFLPPIDFLTRLVGEFEDCRIGAVQARWGHLNADYSHLTRAQALALDGHGRSPLPR